MKASDLILNLASCVYTDAFPQKPGAAVLRQPEEVRAVLRTLLSEQIANVRPDLIGLVDGRSCRKTCVSLRQ